jgi:PAS domain S-box-containing protein
VRLTANPKFIYAQAPKYNKLLKRNGDVYIHEQGNSWVLLEDRYHNYSQKTRYDCDYTRGVLAGIPTMFDMPIAHVEEIECQVRPETYGSRKWPDRPKQGCKGCLYRVHWDSISTGSFIKRLFRRRRVYQKAIEDLMVANREIQEKYEEVKRLAGGLEAANENLAESKKQLETYAFDLQVSERRYRLLAENLTDIIWTFDLGTMRFNYVSPSVQKIRGFTPEEAMALSLEETLASSSLQRVMGLLKDELHIDGHQDVDPNRSKTVEVEQSYRDGSFAWAEATMTFIRDENGRPVSVLGITRDITERKRAEERLNAEKELLAVTLKSIGDGVITTDRHRRITLINRVGERLTGWRESEAIGMPLQKVFTTVDEMTRKSHENPMQEVLDSDKIMELDNNTLLVSRNGNEYSIAGRTAPILDAAKRIVGVVLVFRDVTKTRRIEKELLKIEKLESLGLLAGGIAHDFNNLLAGIVGNVSLAKLDIGSPDDALRSLEATEKAALRAKDLTQQLLTFSKGGEPVKKPGNLKNLIEESSLFALRGSKVKCEFAFQSNMLFSKVDEGQISQVIQNLVINAEQAMPDGGIIQIHGERINLFRNNALSLEAGEYVKLTFRDRGIGIEDEHLKKIFDPYFSTKQKGSGLGLAVAFSIIDKHSGRITVDSKLGMGTIFTIYLPAIEELDSESEENKIPIAPGTGKILFMDDESFIRELAVDLIQKIGDYEVTVAKDGEEVIHLYQQALKEGSAFDAVILDLTVRGGMGGKEAIRKLREIDPKVRAIVSSGYSTDPVMSNFRAYGFQEAVKKPYKIQDMSEALNSVLA